MVRVSSILRPHDVLGLPRRNGRVRREGRRPARTPEPLSQSATSPQQVLAGVRSLWRTGR